MAVWRDSQGFDPVDARDSLSEHQLVAEVTGHLADVDRLLVAPRQLGDVSPRIGSFARDDPGSAQPERGPHHVRATSASPRQ